MIASEALLSQAPSEAGEPIVQRKRTRHELLLGLDHQQHAAGLIAARDRALELDPGHVAGDQQRPLDLGELDAPLADRGREFAPPAPSAPVRRRLERDPFDEAVDDGELQRAAVDQPLRGHDDPGQDGALIGIEMLQPSGDS